MQTRLLFAVFAACNSWAQGAQWPYPLLEHRGGAAELGGAEDKEAGSYHGLVITTLDVTEKPGSNGRVIFDSNTKEGTTAVFLENIDYKTKKKWFKRDHTEFEAVKVDEKEVVKRMKREGSNPWHKKPLLCIHGFNVRPEGHLKTCHKAIDRFNKYGGKFYLLPVIWPSEGKLPGYWGDNGHSKRAGKALKKSLKEFKCFTDSKSLLAHSMGNRVLQFAADKDYKFDEIFMVAADVDATIFETKRGGIIKSMVRDSEGQQHGKIYVVFNPKDKAVMLSKRDPWKHALFSNFRARLGANGLKNGDGDHEEIESKEKDWNEKDDALKDHSYQFEKGAIKFYNQHCL